MGERKGMALQSWWVRGKTWAKRSPAFLALTERKILINQYASQLGDSWTRVKESLRTFWCPYFATYTMCLYFDVAKHQV